MHHSNAAACSVAQLEILCFHAWWTESNSISTATTSTPSTVKRRVHIYFSILTQHFQVVLDDADDVFTISHIVHPTTGRLLTAWDLHVGARIPVLGRLTTLMQASLLTRQWLAHYERTFDGVRRSLQTELAKYELKKGRSSGSASIGGHRIECAEPHRSQSGCSLRTLLSDIATLKHALGSYRPDVARRICADIADLDV